MDQTIVNPQSANQQTNAPQMPKPDNNLVLAIICTVCCCLPLGIVGIVKASKVNGLYMSGMYDLAVKEAQEAKKWSIIGIAVGAVIGVLYVLLYAVVGVAALS